MILLLLSGHCHGAREELIAVGSQIHDPPILPDLVNYMKPVHGIGQVAKVALQAASSTAKEAIATGTSYATNGYELASFFKWQMDMMSKMYELRLKCEGRGGVVLALSAATVIAAAYGTWRSMTSRLLLREQVKWLDLMDRGLVEASPIGCGGNCTVDVQQALGDSPNLTYFAKTVAQVEYMRFTLTSLGSEIYHKCPGETIVVRWGTPSRAAREDLSESFLKLRMGAPEYPKDLELSKAAGFSMSAEDAVREVQEVATTWRERGEKPLGLNSVVEDHEKWMKDNAKAKVLYPQSTGVWHNIDFAKPILRESGAVEEDGDAQDSDDPPDDLEDRTLARNIA
eukprot:gnl/TRDRNA2_/TRDRNA2_127653_c0_seq1.p1 gnl/TRDRNA2_/TRDRNA2_127653_c0~~gnl/TRDRNA2_/TRDRNA2_127653_c0_seq1.p1  ORF type:complete len:341 (+),score=43.85 gnl/TRDRNA2_/TRDRNA2_127653_c0_seq1:2-1024(+)